MTTTAESDITAELKKSVAPFTGDSEKPRTDIAVLLQQRRLNPDIVPPKLRPIYSLNGLVIATPGNLATINAGAKDGKTAIVGALIASVMAKRKDVDLLGFSSSNPNSYAVIHLDSEQSPDEHWLQFARAKKRAGRRRIPAWVHSYCLTGLEAALALECVWEAIRLGAELHGGIHSILIDGVADLVPDVNDPGASNTFVANLHGVAIRYDCPIIGVIHFNPGSDKSRGHLGSQLERKAETNLRLDKKDGVTTVWPDKQRRAPIPKSTGPRFRWSDEAGMHVSVEARQADTDDEEVARLTLLAEEIFADHPTMRYSALISTVKKRQKVTKRTAERRVSRMATLKVICKSTAGYWTRRT